MMHSLAVWSAAVLMTLAAMGCATMLGIDGEYSELAGTGGDRLDSGGTPNGTGGTSSTEAGPMGSGGVTGSGGTNPGDASGSGGSGGGSGCGVTGAECTAPMKCCAGTCLAPAPLVGCSSTGCTPCEAPPADGVVICSNNECGIQCNPGFEPGGNQCVALGAGGATGLDSGKPPGTGGAPAPTCDYTRCPGCGLPGPQGCCKNDQTCGCTWVLVTPANPGNPKLCF